MKILCWLLAIVALGIVALCGWLYIAPPELIRVGSHYTAKMVCSNVFLAKRDPQTILQVDVQAPGHPILSVMQIDVDRDAKTVRANLLGLFGGGLAVYREGYGCTSLPNGDLSKLALLPSAAEPKASQSPSLWPYGEGVRIEKNEALEKVLSDTALQGPDMRAIIVVKDGAIIGETYGEGFSQSTPLLGWSMAKTVTAAMAGIAVKNGETTLEADDLFTEWKTDQRSKVKLQDLLGMASDLEWNEGYGSVSDVTRMLFLEPDMAGLASSRPLNQTDGSKIGSVFNYSSGTSVMVARYLQSLQDSKAGSVAMARRDIFDALGMSSALMEVDARGNLVGGSYVYATARDWARFGQMLLQKGRWQGKQILPEGFVDWMTTPHSASEKGEYGQGHIWLRPPGANRPGKNPEFNHRAFWMAGHDGQSVAILPDENMVIVRMGLTPSKLGYKAASLTNAVVAAVGKKPE